MARMQIPPLFQTHIHQESSAPAYRKQSFGRMNLRETVISRKGLTAGTFPCAAYSLFQSRTSMGKVLAYTQLLVGD
jgi:hypothetical protein